MDPETAESPGQKHEDAIAAGQSATTSPFKRWDERRRDELESSRPRDLAAGSGVLTVESPDDPILARVSDDTILSLPNGPRTPAVAQTLEWVRRPVEFMEANRRRYGPTFLARLGPLQNVLFLSEPAYVKAVLTGDTDLLRTGDINGVFRPIIGSHSILLLDGPPHMEERKLLLPPFHGRSLQGFRAVIQEAA